MHKAGYNQFRWDRCSSDSSRTGFRTYRCDGRRRYRIKVSRW